MYRKLMSCVQKKKYSLPTLFINMSRIFNKRQIMDTYCNLVVIFILIVNV